MDKTPLEAEKPKFVKPAYVAQRCPVCNGFGTLKYGEKVCNGCEGKGYVLVPTEIIPKKVELVAPEYRPSYKNFTKS